MPRHGIGRKKEFICVKHTENSIVFSITGNEEYSNYYIEFEKKEDCTVW